MSKKKSGKKAKTSCLLHYFIIAVVTLFIVFFAKSQFNNKDEFSIGGEINLTDQFGKKFSLVEQKKEVSLVFFGFTHCPSFCPIAVEQLSLALNILTDKEREEVNVIFITVDPDRDTPEVIADFLTHFHSDIKGLTGNQEDINKIVQRYKVYSNKVDTDEEGNPAGEDMGHGYLMDHSTYIYVVDHRGRYLEHTYYDVDEAEIVDIVRKYIK